MKYKEFPNFLTPQECEFIKRTCAPNLIKSLSFDPAKKVLTDKVDICNNYTAYLNKEMGGEAARIIEKILVTTECPSYSYFEQLQVVKYDDGGYYKRHHDAPAYPDKNPRVFTFLIYLNDVVAGGDTVFPKLGLSFKPKMGKAVFWQNFDLDGNLDWETEHESTVVRGEKWIATQWIKLNPLF